MKLEVERKEITRLQAALDNVLPHHRNEDELDELELEMDKESEDLDVNIIEIMNESGNVDNSEDDDYIVEEEDIEEDENEESFNETITSYH